MEQKIASSRLDRKGLVEVARFCRVERDERQCRAVGVIIERAARQDARLRLLQPGRVGLVAALNLGVAQARAALQAIIDQQIGVEVRHHRGLRFDRRERSPHARDAPP